MQIHIAPKTLAAQDRAVFYGDGLFSTIAVQQGQALAWAYHQERLVQDSQRLGFPLWDASALDQAVADTAAQMQSGVLKCLLSRGSGGRGYFPPNKPALQVYLYSYPFPDYSSEEVCVRLCQTRLAQQPLLAGMKHLNRLEQVMARQEWQDSHIREGLLCDTQGWLIEGCMSNLFFIKNTRLYTPDLSQAGVAGIIRGRIIDLSRQLGISVSVGQYRLEDLRLADGVFICNSIMGLCSVNQLLDTQQQRLQQWPAHPLVQRLKSALLTQQWIAS